MKTVAIIQARMGSTRFPGKVLQEAAGKPLLRHMIERLMSCKTLDDVVVAMPETRDSQPIAQLIADLILEDGYGSKVGWVGGDEVDVLSRVLVAARTMQADVIVELTADCPLIDPVIVDEAVRRFQGAQGLRPPLALVSTSRPSFHLRNRRYAYPPGMDVRVFTTKTLEEVDRTLKTAMISENEERTYREHVSLYIWEHQRRFWCHDFLASPELQDDARLTVDTPEDLALVGAIFDHFAPRNDFSLEEILGFVRANPELRDLNAHVQQKAIRPEGVVS